MRLSLLKIALSIELILVAVGAWFALDYLNKQEQAQAQSIHNGLQLARMEVQKRTQQKTDFQNFITSLKTNCETAAVNANDSYVAILKKSMPLKRKVQLDVPAPLLEEAALVLSRAKEQCQKQADEQLKNGGI